ncbi:hypothetical protein [Acinetobacter sp. TSRC1-2]|uniref:hypothetical protein n=1 Tax=unclassified Acinetobacter TaxID=196816 RepID=UPI003CE87E11
MNDIQAKRNLLETVDKLVRKPTTISELDLVNIFVHLGSILKESFADPMEITPIFSGRKSIVPTKLGELTADQKETERQMFIRFLKFQPHVLNIGYNTETQQFLLKEDQAAWDAWLYRAMIAHNLLQSNEVPKDQLERFNTHYKKTPKGYKITETVMSFWNRDCQRFMIDEIQNEFETWSKAS